jgi:hypothetical protein
VGGAEPGGGGEHALRGHEDVPATHWRYQPLISVFDRRASERLPAAVWVGIRSGTSETDGTATASEMAARRGRRPRWGAGGRECCIEGGEDGLGVVGVEALPLRVQGGLVLGALALVLREGGGEPLVGVGPAGPSRGHGGAVEDADADWAAAR